MCSLTQSLQQFYKGERGGGRRFISHGECMLEEYGENDRLEENRGVEGISELCDF